MAKAYFPLRIKTATDGQVHVKLIGKNGKTLTNSENFKTKASAFKNIAAQAKAWEHILNTVGIVGVIEALKKAKPVKGQYGLEISKKGMKRIKEILEQPKMR